MVFIIVIVVIVTITTLTATFLQRFLLLPLSPGPWGSPSPWAIHQPRGDVSSCPGGLGVPEKQLRFGREAVPASALLDSHSLRES